MKAKELEKRLLKRGDKNEKIVIENVNIKGSLNLKNLNYIIFKNVTFRDFNLIRKNVDILIFEECLFETNVDIYECDINILRFIKCRTIRPVVFNTNKIINFEIRGCCAYSLDFMSCHVIEAKVESNQIGILNIKSMPFNKTSFKASTFIGNSIGEWNNISTTFKTTQLLDNVVSDGNFKSTVFDDSNINFLSLRNGCITNSIFNKTDIIDCIFNDINFDHTHISNECIIEKTTFNERNIANSNIPEILKLDDKSENELTILGKNCTFKYKQ